MAFRGRSALPSVQTGDWDVPPAFGESPDTRAADAYKLGLVILRLFARSHDARAPAPHLRYVPVELRDLLYRSLGENAMNRPAAEQWQRALGRLLADGRLDERYPGPAAAPRLRPPAASASTSVSSPPVARTGPVRPLRSPRAAARPAVASHVVAQAMVSANSAAAPLWLRRTVVVLWIVAGSAVLLVVLSRLFAAAVPVPDSGGGSSAGATVPYYQYTGPGQRSPQGGSPGGVQLP
jgi:hypothetical protein